MNGIHHIASPALADDFVNNISTPFLAVVEKRSVSNLRVVIPHRLNVM